ncbi:MAG: beta-N-acetylhexosaminidase [Myxococcaceae bacterium]|nr:beta-N-acetylhexosaminidase [Myxococcaceae bacterium]
MNAALEQIAAGLFVIGFPGTTPDDDVKRLIDDGVAGVILFKRNVGTPDETLALVQGLKAHAGRLLLAAVDQEGGRVARLKGAPFTALPPMRELGLTRDAALLERVGRLLAFETRACGFDWDFAPVLDVDTNPANPVIGDRSLHKDAAEVARLGVALAQGLEAGGVASCGKHFPGHGDTTKDSHLDLPSLPHGFERLDAVELVPFAAYARAGLASIMTAHVVFEALDPTVPATMSRKVMTGLLRERLGFQGVIVSDDLEMKAVADHFPIERAVVEGLDAGVDCFLVCHHADVQRRAIDAVVRAVRSGRLSEAQVRTAHGRVARLTRQFVRGAGFQAPTLGSPAHRQLAEGLEAHAFAGRDPTERHA